MRRQLGADTIDMDTLEGIARYGLIEPQTINFPNIEKAAYSAGYTLTELSFTLVGVTSQFSRTPGGDKLANLKVPKTSQVFELKGDVPIGQTLRVHGSIEDWSTTHPAILVDSFDVLQTNPTRTSDQE